MKSNNTGTYIYDKKTGKIVKVSDSVPSLKKDNAHKCGNGCGCSHSCCHGD